MAWFLTKWSLLAFSDNLLAARSATSTEHDREKRAISPLKNYKKKKKRKKRV